MDDDRRSFDADRAMVLEQLGRCGLQGYHELQQSTGLRHARIAAAIIGLTADKEVVVVHIGGNHHMVWALNPARRP